MQKELEIDLAQLRTEKNRIMEKIQPLFDSVFEYAPSSGSFPQRYYKMHPAYLELNQTISKEKELLSGIVVCRTISSGVWFPVFHWSHENIEQEKIKIDEGATRMTYILAV